jgi:hypothetical protein
MRQQISYLQAGQTRLQGTMKHAILLINPAHIQTFYIYVRLFNINLPPTPMSTKFRFSK